MRMTGPTITSATTMAAKRAAASLLVAANGAFMFQPAAASGLDMQEGRLRMTFAMVRFDALPPLVDALARAGLLPTDVTLQPRVEPGFVRAELAFKVSK